ncbi:geranylgeranyl transferase type II beta subunit, putative [Eimeria praecox]|uniref:Geranylgeranyl transferase type II subunit beta n=1 Tax=Eimeria praecox TaxID=51316 RepID=U6H1C5_9EIME|nr:geranylgeranyl transferase type II beta subunit, putative [Eimeria praecox]
MEVESKGEGRIPSVVPELWRLDVMAHRLYIQRQLERGLRVFCQSSCAEETPSTSSGGAPAGAVLVPFMEQQQQQQSLLSGVYWTLCCLALLQPRAAVSLPSQAEQHQEKTLLSLPLNVKEDLISKVILPCLRRSQCSGWVSAAPEVESAADPAKQGAKFGKSKTVEASSQRPVPTSPGNAASAAAGSCTHCSLSAVGFSSHLGEDATATALSTCSGLQALALLGALHVLPEGVLQQLRRFVLSLQRREDGAFANTLHPSHNSSWCSSCSLPLAGAAVTTAAPASAKEEWESEGDVRCTFCCLLSLKLIHAAVKAHRKHNAAPSLSQEGAMAANAFSRATPAESAAGEPVVCQEGPTKPNRSSVQPSEKPIYGASWEAFLQDPLAGVRVDATVSWLLSLLGPDGGVGVSPGAEPHAGAAFCFAGCLSLLGRRDAVGTEEARRLERQDKLTWLRERQLPEGSLQGRPGKKGDSCYTFWVTAALLLLGKAPLKVLKSSALAASVAAAQHPSGGISRAPAFFSSAARKCCMTTASSVGYTEPTKVSNGDNRNGICSSMKMLSMGPLDSAEEQLQCPDPFHTFFALAGLALLAHSGDAEAMEREQQQRQPHEEGQEQHTHQHVRWQTTCTQLLQPLDPETALPLHLANSL